MVPRAQQVPVLGTKEFSMSYGPQASQDRRHIRIVLAVSYPVQMQKLRLTHGRQSPKPQEEAEQGPPPSPSSKAFRTHHCDSYFPLLANSSVSVVRTLTLIRNNSLLVKCKLRHVCVCVLV